MAEDKPKIPFHEQVAAEMIKALEDGTAPWIKPWEPGAPQGGPENALTGKPYRGINYLRLGMMQAAYGSEDRRWCTYKQAAELGAQVKKGSRGMLVQYWKQEDRKLLRDKQGKPLLDSKGKKQYEVVKLERPQVFHAVVFHASQIENLPPLPKVEAKPGAEFERHERSEKLLQASGAAIFHDQANRAFYRPSTDEIHLPQKEQFHTPDGYYSTALHELGHWTGHESRLNRELVGHPFGSGEYAREELRAEIASYMLGMELGIGHDPGQHKAYVANWVEALKNDPKEIIRAARDADKIKEYVLGLEKEKTAEVEGEMEQEPEEREEPTAEAPETKEEEVIKEPEEREEPTAEAPKAKEEEVIKEPEEQTTSSREEDAPATGEQQEPPPDGPQPAQEDTRLQVPYKEKDEAKKFGAKWDARNKTWYAPKGTDLAPLKKWLPENQPPPPSRPETLDPRKEFGEALRSVGLVIEGDPVMDGKIHRVPVQGGKPGALDGAYSGYADGRPNGWYQNHKTGIRGKWVATGHVLPQAARDVLRRESAEKLEAREEERRETQDRAMKRAYAKYMNAEPVQGQDHPYLQEKGVEAFGLRRDKNGNLLVPGYDLETGRIKTIEHISQKGAKWYERDCPKQGAVGLLPDKDALKSGEVVLMVEGYATGASVHQATGLPVAVAFDAGNIKDAAMAIKRKMPNVKLTICADNDAPRTPDAKNVGVLKAKEAAAAVGAKVVVADFSKSEKERGLTDFNDLHKARGLDAVRNAVLGKTQEREAEGR